MDQFVIKALLIAGFVLFAFVLLRAGVSARRQAFHTIALLVFLVAAIIAVVSPGIVNDLALSVGVGRGADLLLYAFILVFMGNALTSTRKRREQDRQITRLARTLALRYPNYPKSDSQSGPPETNDSPTD